MCVVVVVVVVVVVCCCCFVGGRGAGCRFLTALIKCSLGRNKALVKCLDLIIIVRVLIFHLKLTRHFIFLPVGG